MWINNQEFLINDKDIPKVPVEFSLDARQFWQEQKKRCIEGYMVGGKWMPPNLYFYLNFWKIQLNRGLSKSKVIAKPELRDIEWLIFPAWSLCRGLSGFENGYNLHDIAKEKDIKNPLADDFVNLLIYPGKNFGSPIYNNQALDLLLVGPREFGKSYISAGGIIAHEWLFNGEKKYLLPHERSSEPWTSNIVVGAGDSSYSKDLLNKFKIGYDEIAKGGLEFNGRYYPHPFFQSYTGSLASGKALIAEYKKKVGGKWIYAGSKSMIKHVSYKDNPFAGQGTRSSVMAKEEIGEFDNLEEARENDKETMMNGANKFGSCLYTGTGGNMNKGTLGLYKFMYDPKTYDMLAFSDKWENKGNIGMFIPATMRNNETKDQNGNTNHEIETIRILKKRQELREGKDSSNALRKEIIYNPLVPSEIFLRGGINRFPIGEIKETLAALETQKIWKDAESIGKLIITPQGKVEWKLDPTVEPIRNFPLRSHEDKKGGICIYEQPRQIEGKILDYMYIAGIDPYDFDEAKHSNSLGSTFIYNRLTHRIVAEYTARPDLSDEYYENVRRLLLYYNATAMYENDKKGLFTYFSNKHSLHLLASSPKIFKDMVPNSKVNRDGKGLHSTLEGNRTGYDFIKRWLLESAGDPDNPEILQVHKLRSPALCNELILFDEENGNFDRVSALVMLFWYVEELRKYDITLTLNTEKPIADDFFSRKMFINKRSLVN